MSLKGTWPWSHDPLFKFETPSFLWNGYRARHLTISTQVDCASTSERKIGLNAAWGAWSGSRCSLNRFAAVTAPHVFRFTWSTDSDVPIPRWVCVPCLTLQIFSLILWKYYPMFIVLWSGKRLSHSVIQKKRNLGPIAPTLLIFK